MKILVLAKQCPYPLDDGASIAIHMLSKGLVEAGATVDLLAFNTVKHRYEGDLARRELSHYGSIELVDLDNRPSMIGAALNMLTNESYHVSRFRSAEMKLKLSTTLPNQAYDIVQIESSHLLIYYDLIRTYHSGKIILRAHNVEHQIWLRYQAQLDRKILSAYHRIQANRLRKIEEQYIAKMDGIMAVSEVDQAYFKLLNQHAFVVPIGLDILPSTSEESQAVSSPRFGFIGSMDWAPNQEGLQWLLDRVLTQTNSDVQIVLAGRNFESAKLDIPNHLNIEILGEIESTSTFWDQVDVLMVPLFSGSGTRVKIIEAFTHQKLVLTTAIGIEGIPATDGEHAVIRDGEGAWHEAINTIMDNWSTYTAIKLNGRQLAENNYEYGRVGAAAMKIYRQLV